MLTCVEILMWHSEIVTLLPSNSLYKVCCTESVEIQMLVCTLWPHKHKIHFVRANFMRSNGYGAILIYFPMSAVHPVELQNSRISFINSHEGGNQGGRFCVYVSS